MPQCDVLWNGVHNFAVYTPLSNHDFCVNFSMPEAVWFTIIMAI